MRPATNTFIFDCKTLNYNNHPLQVATSGRLSKTVLKLTITSSQYSPAFIAALTDLCGACLQ